MAKAKLLRKLPGEWIYVFFLACANCLEKLFGRNLGGLAWNGARAIWTIYQFNLPGEMQPASPEHLQHIF